MAGGAADRRGFVGGLHDTTGTAYTTIKSSVVGRCEIAIKNAFLIVYLTGLMKRACNGNIYTTPMSKIMLTVTIAIRKREGKMVKVFRNGRFVEVPEKSLKNDTK